jgi:thiamine phosphate synthase YjbQ (UPF0047 family)
MALVTDTVAVSTRGDSHMLDLTPQVQQLVRRHGFLEGQALVFVPRHREVVVQISGEKSGGPR